MPHDATLPPTALADSSVRPPAISVLDDVLDAPMDKRVRDFVNHGGWKFGWKSDAKTDQYSFWHRHFAGSIHPDHYVKEGKGTQYDCGEELKQTAPVLHEFWTRMRASALTGHVLMRCYANGHPFGSDGSVHTDSLSERSFTSIYYAHDKWHPNWGGETVFFNKNKTDIITSIYPKPNRLIIFRGLVPHLARGATRVCPVLRVTLMFKTELRDA